MNKQIRIGLVQSSCSADTEANFAKAVAGIREAAQKGAAVVCLQELFRSLYFCDQEDYDNFSLAEPVPGPSVERLCKVAREADIAVIASLFEKRAEGVYHNTIAVIDRSGQYLGKYRKMHIPDDPGYYEKFYFTPGDLGYKVFQSAGIKAGTLVCWDQWYPEAARITSLLGAEILFYPTAIGWATSQDEDTNRQQYHAWQTIQKSHAIANGVFVAAANRVGIEKNMRFWGGSFVADPFGNVICQASHDKEEVLIADLDLSRIDFFRTHWPFLRDRRIDSYEPITKRFLDDYPE
ncbi:MAG: apolipoprotein acyltransferase [Chitinophagales bacterium]|nr:MAG: apolipoprotein acyltransferase [Chitinophagales bacterium]